MNKYDVYLREVLLIKYTVSAESAEHARDIVLSGEYDDETYQLVDALDCDIDSIELKGE